jgi:sulfoxide reductase catalytic subunit YedY
MHIRRRKTCQIPDSQATPEAVYRDRRRLVQAMGFGSVLLASGAAGLLSAPARAAEGDDPSAGLYPFKRNAAFTLDRPLSDERLVSTYNNFYEFGSSKDIVAQAGKLAIRPWTVTIDGMVEAPITLGIDELLAKMPLEERPYRHRCVEAWSMAVPWSGFALAALVALAKPLGSAKYLTMQTFLDPEVARGQRATWYPWPYTEGLTMAEATNELAFMATGLYGKPLANANGAPLRLVVPWKYGFKSVKSVVRFEFTDQRPHTFWEVLGPDEYGFWANINPQVPHPRWSQATELPLGASERVPTLLFNGYGAQVADLYKGLEGERLYA